MLNFKGMKRQHVVYTVKDMETGKRRDLHEFRLVSEGLRAPDMTGRYRIVEARVVSVY